MTRFPSPLLPFWIACTVSSACGTTGPPAPAAEVPLSAPSTQAELDRAALTELVHRAAAETRAAWEARDARRMLPGDPDEVLVRTPDGRNLTRAMCVADIQRRMDMTKSIDEMDESVERIELDGDRAEVYSSQRFARVMALPDGAERRRISSVTHKRTFRRAAGEWRAEGALEEIDPKAWWEDEGPPGGG